MKSFNESTQSLEFKSSLELRAFQFADSNPKISKYSIEPFAVQYVKPTDNRIHRYYPDMLINFKTGHTFLVEIKSKGETTMPKKPKKITPKSTKNHKKAVETFAINTAKWKAAKQFCEDKEIKFIIITEDQLKP